MAAGLVAATEADIRATVTDSVEKSRPHQRRVGDRVDAVRIPGPDAFGDAGSPGHDVGRAGRPDQGLVGGRGIGDHGQPRVPAQLDQVAAERPGRAGDGEDRAGGERQLVEGPQRGEPVHRQRRRGRVLDARRRPDDPAGRQHHVLGVAARGRADRHHHRHHRLPRGQLGVRSRPDLVDHAGDVHAGDVRGRHAGERRRVHAGTDEGVRRVHRGRVHSHPDLTGSGMGFRQVDDPQHVGSPEVVKTDRAHMRSSLMVLFSHLVRDSYHRIDAGERQESTSRCPGITARTAPGEPGTPHTLEQWGVRSQNRTTPPGGSTSWAG